jgi:hypothetical protein
MRSFLVLPAFVLVMAGFCFCIEKGATPVKQDYVNPHVVAPENFQTAGQFALSTREFAKRHLHYSPTDNTCYTMRSLLVAKKPGSDVTDVVGQRTCTPASHFQTKNSVQQPN